MYNHFLNSSEKITKVRRGIRVSQSLSLNSMKKPLEIKGEKGPEYGVESRKQSVIT